MNVITFYVGFYEKEFHRSYGEGKRKKGGKKKKEKKRKKKMQFRPSTVTDRRFVGVIKVFYRN